MTRTAEIARLGTCSRRNSRRGHRRYTHTTCTPTHRSGVDLIQSSCGSTSSHCVSGLVLLGCEDGVTVRATPAIRRENHQVHVCLAFGVAFVPDEWPLQLPRHALLRPALPPVCDVISYANRGSACHTLSVYVYRCHDVAYLPFARPDVSPSSELVRAPLFGP